MLRYLEGKEVTPYTVAELSALVGKRVTYLLPRDIDRSGRGYIFPRTGTIAAVKWKNIAIDHPENFVMTLDEIVEMVLVEEPPCAYVQEP